MSFIKHIVNYFKKTEFKIGDTVRCIDDRGWNGDATDIKLIYNKKYRIQGMIKCPCCQELCFDINGRFFDLSKYTNCSVGNTDIPGQGIHWAAARRFDKAIGNAAEETAINKEEKKKELEKALAEEDYKKAAQLRDLINK